jgi:hypothetical protein
MLSAPRLVSFHRYLFAGHMRFQCWRLQCETFCNCPAAFRLFVSENNQLLHSAKLVLAEKEVPHLCSCSIDRGLFVELAYQTYVRL